MFGLMNSTQNFESETYAHIQSAFVLDTELCERATRKSTKFSQDETSTKVAWKTLNNKTRHNPCLSLFLTKHPIMQVVFVQLALRGIFVFPETSKMAASQEEGRQTFFIVCDQKWV